VDKLAWIIELIDKVSGPGRNIIVIIQSITINMGKMGGATKQAGGDWKALVGALDHGLNLLKQIGSVALKVGDALYEGSKFALGALAFKESTLASFELMLRSREEADRMFSQAVEFGARTPFETATVIDSFRQLLSSGFKKEEVPIVFQALGDISAASGFNPTTMSAITTQLAQVKALGRLTMADLRVITSWSGQAGVGIQVIYKELADLLHVPVTAIPKMQHAGQISADAFIFAFLKAVRGRTAQNELGTIMETQSRTLIGLWSTIKSAPEDFFYRMKKRVEEMRGIEQLKAGMENFIALMAAGSPQAERLGGVLERVFGDLLFTVFGDLSGPEGLEKMRNTLDEVVTRLEQVDWKEIFTQAKVFILDTAEAVMFLAKGIGYVVTGLNELRHPGSTYDRLSKGTVRQLTESEKQEVLRSRLGEEPLIEYQTEGTYEGKRFRGHIHSSLPSGDDAATGYLGADLQDVLNSGPPIPKMAAGGVVDAPTLAVIGEAGPEAVIPLDRLGSGAGGRASVQVGEVHIHVQVGGGGEGDDLADRVAAKLREILPAELAAVFEDLATEGGA